VEVRPQPGSPAVEVAVEPGLEVRDLRRLALVAQLGLHEPELAGAFREARLERRNSLMPPDDELGAERRDLLVPRRERLTRREPLRHPAQRSVALTDGRSVLGREPGTRRSEPSEHANEGGAARPRAALPDD